MRDTDVALFVGALCLLDGPADAAAVERTLSERAARSPRFSRRPENGLSPWLGAALGKRAEPDHAVHLRRESPRQPGSDADLAGVVAEVWSRPLPRSAPFEVTLIEGLADESSAIVLKAERNLADDRGGLELAYALLRDDPVPPPGTRGTRRLPPVRRRPPDAGPMEKSLSSLSWPVLAGTRFLGRAVHELSDPVSALARARGAAGWLETTSLVLSTPAPETPINGPLGTARGVALARYPRDVFLGIEETLGAAREEIILAIVAEALGHYLRARGRATTALDLVALVAPGATDGTLAANGNGALLPIPVGHLGAQARLTAIRSRLADPATRARHASLEAVLELGQSLPAPLRSVAISLAFQAVNTLCVRARPLPKGFTVGGRRPVVVAAVPSLPVGVGLGFAWCESGDDELVIAVHTDAGLVPDPGVVMEGLDAAYTELAAASGVPAIRARHLAKETAGFSAKRAGEPVRRA